MLNLEIARLKLRLCTPGAPHARPAAGVCRSDLSAIRTERPPCPGPCNPLTAIARTRSTLRLLVAARGAKRRVRRRLPPRPGAGGPPPLPPRQPDAHTARLPL